MLMPRDIALEEPRNRLPMEHIERTRRPLCFCGRNVGVWTIGKTGWKFAKYAWMHRFFTVQSQQMLKLDTGSSALESRTRKVVDGNEPLCKRGCSLSVRSLWQISSTLCLSSVTSGVMYPDDAPSEKVCHFRWIQDLVALANGMYGVGAGDLGLLAAGTVGSCGKVRGCGSDGAVNKDGSSKAMSNSFPAK